MTQFFVLTPVSGATLSRPGQEIQVAAVHIPADLDRQEMVERNQDGQLAVSDQNRWGAPFDEMVQRALTQDLAARLPHKVVYPNEPAPPKTKDLVLDILAFSGDNSGLVHFDGSWSLVDPASNATVLSRHVELTEQGIKGYGGEAQAMSKLLGRLADQIAGAVNKA
jgi:uncharacterized protein